MPDRMKRPLVWQDAFPGTYYWEAIKIIFKYPLLIGLCACIAIDSFAFRGMGSVAGNQLWMGPLKFKQEEWLIPHLIGMICGIPANLLGAIIIPRVGVWKAIFFGEISGIILGLGGNMWPIFFMNYYHCWGTIHCGDGTWGTELFWAKWGGVIATHILGTFVGAISGPAGEAMISLQVSQTEQASIQAAFRLVSSLSGMYLLQGRYTPSKSFNLPLPLGPCMTPTFLGVGTRRFTSRITISTSTGPDGKSSRTRGSAIPSTRSRSCCTSQHSWWTAT